LKPLPSVKVLIFLAIGISIAYWINLPPAPVVISAILSLLISIIFIHRNISQYLIPFALIASGACAYLSSIPPSGFEPIKTRVIGRICEPPSIHSNSSSFPLDNVFLLMGDNYDAVYKKIWIRTQAEVSPEELGSYIDATGKLYPFKPRRNPADFDLKLYRERNGYFGEFYIDRSSNPVKQENNSSVLISIRKFILSSIKTHIPTETPVLNALILGIRRDIDSAFLDALKSTGLLHLIALSGLHVGFLAAMLFGLGAILRFSLTGRVIFAICGILLFLLLVPPRASTLRAAIMIILLISGPVLKRWNPPLNSIGFAGILILCFRPGDLFDIGFQFSFAAITGLVLFSEPINRFGRRFVENRGKTIRLIKRFILVPLLISASASVMIMPFTAYHFDYITPATPIFNLFALPLMSLVYVGGWLMIFFSFFSETFASLVSESLQLLIYIWRELTVFLAQTSPRLTISFSPLSMFLLLSIVIWTSLSNRKMLFKTVAVILIIPSIIVWENNLQRNSKCQVWFLDVGQGDAVVINYMDKGVFVIDAGPQSYEDRYNVVVNSLRKLKFNKIDLLVASHPDADHIGGMSQLISEFPVDLAVTTSAGSETNAFRNLKKTSVLNNLYWHTVSTGDRIETNTQKCQISVLNPPPESDVWSTNDASVVLLVSFDVDCNSYSDLLFTGDIGNKAEHALLRNHQIKAGLLKVSHHGSNKSSSTDFLRAVNPGYAVISRSSRFASSTGRTLNRLAEQQIRTLETVHEGALLFEPCRSGKSNWEHIDWRNPGFTNWLIGRNI